MAPTPAQLTQLYEKLKASYNGNDLTTASDVLGQLKLLFIQLPSLPPTFQQSPTAQQELLIVREVNELAVLLSLKQRDEAAMDRGFTQLFTYYDDTRSLLPASAQEQPMIGLNLLRLLVQNRIAEFHTELELVPPEIQAQTDIKLAIQLEQWLMEGAYNKMLGAAAQLPPHVHGFLMSQLTTTVRDEIASCSEKAYSRLSLADAHKMMMFDSQKAVVDYAEQRGWFVEGGYIIFQKPDLSAMKEVPSLKIINNTLVYAKELERIV